VYPTPLIDAPLVPIEPAPSWARFDALKCNRAFRWNANDNGAARFSGSRRMPPTAGPDSFRARFDALK